MSKAMKNIEENKKIIKKSTKTMDANEAVAYIAYYFTEVAGIYPITPSSAMAELTDLWASKGKKNIFGLSVKLVQMQSEAGAAATVQGSLQVGTLTTTFSSAQGLLLKIPNMYKIAGQFLPAVFHVATRSLAGQAASIFCDHQDIYATRATGFAMLCSHSVQESMDLAAIAHLAAIKASLPFMHFFDGFRSSHEIQKIEVMEYEHLLKLVDQKALKAYRARALNCDDPKTVGVVQGPDIYFQNKEVANVYYKSLADIVAAYMQDISKLTGRFYKPFIYYGAKHAKNIVVAMGSVTQALEEVVDYLNAKGESVGVLKVYLYRPFSTKHLFEVIPKSVEKIAVLDRTKEAASLGEPLYLDIKAAFYDYFKHPLIIGGRYGLSSKDVDPASLIAVFDNLKSENPIKGFTIGINDDLTHLSLKSGKKISLVDDSTIECLFYGLGADGTVGANKNSIKIIGEKTKSFVQAYFVYGASKSGGFTCSHLRFSKRAIRATYLVSTPHFIACSVPAYLDIYEVIDGIREGGTFLLNSIWSAKETAEKIPIRVKKILAKRKINFYIINATKLARDIGLGNRTNTIMQSAFFKLAKIIDYEEAVSYMKEFAKKTYENKGKEIVAMNYEAIAKGGAALIKIEVEPSWAELIEEKKEEKKEKLSFFVEKIARPMLAGKGDDIAVSTLLKYPDGHLEHGASEFEKRGVGVMVPRWIEANCIQCNQCASVCPHAVIRPFLLDDAELKAAPPGVKAHNIKAKGIKTKLSYKIQVSALDCTGCELCVHECPAREKSLVMVPLEEELLNKEQENADYLFKKVAYKDNFFKKDSVKGSQFAQPLFEFHGACPGCGETPYITLLTRLFGEDMQITNATGCGSVYGGSSPSSTFRRNIKNGQGPAWANSLFEDNAEFGLGIKIATDTKRRQIAKLMQESIEEVPNALSALYKEWLEKKESIEESKLLKPKIEKLLAKNPQVKNAKELIELKPFLAKKSHWFIGGDGWAYDIGYGGLDHVLASAALVRVLILDTQAYSNTGGQSSKASSRGSAAAFTIDGKATQKKDMGQIMMAYGNIFVAQINSNASFSDTIKIMQAANAYNGPSLLIAYSPCIAHGIKGGLSNSIAQAKLASDCGYWPTYVYNPELSKEGKNPLKILGKEPNWDLYEEFLLNEVRFSSLVKKNPKRAKELFALNKSDAQKKYRQLKRQAMADFSDELL